MDVDLNLNKTSPKQQPKQQPKQPPTVPQQPSLPPQSDADSLPDAAVDYFESNELYEDMRKSVNAARSRKAKEVLDEWYEERVTTGDEAGAAFIQDKMKDLQAYVDEYSTELDKLLFQEDFGGDDESRIQYGRHKRVLDDSVEYHDAEELEDCETAMPPTKK